MGVGLDKEAVARAFSQAAPAYDQWAQPQRHIARRLGELLPQIQDGVRVLELGCGTGLFTTELRHRYPSAHILGLDLAPGMIEACRHRWGEDGRMEFAVADAEDLRKADRFDLIASSCSVQWFTNHRRTFRRLGRLLGRGGHMAVSAVLAGTLGELGDCYRRVVGTAFGTVKLHEPEFYTGLLENAGLRVREARTERFEVLYRDGLELLRALKETGTTFRPHSGHRVRTASEVRTIVRRYEEGYRRSDGWLPATYRVLYVVGQDRQ